MADQMNQNGVMVETTPDVAEESTLEIDFMELFYRLLDKAWIIIAVALIAGIASGLYTHFFVDETYTATMKMYVIGGNDTVIDLTQLNFGDKLAGDYVQVFKNRDVHAAVKKYLYQYDAELNENDYAYFDSFEGPYELPSFETVQRNLTVSQLSNTRILSISYSCGNKDEAKMILHAYALWAQEFITAYMGTDTPPTVFEQPYASAKPTSPKILKNVAIAMMLGLIITVGIIIGHFVIDDRIRTAEQLEKYLGLPTIGMMPTQENCKKSKIRRREGKQ